MVARGWLPADLAREAGIAGMTVRRFLAGERQTARMAKKMADALGCKVGRYFVTHESAPESTEPTGPVQGEFVLEGSAK